jgi:hypothetical protein
MAENANVEKGRYQSDGARLLNKTQAADFFGVSRRTVGEWRKKGGFGPTWTKLPGGREVTTLQSCREFADRLSKGQLQLPLGGE